MVISEEDIDIFLNDQLLFDCCCIGYAKAFLKSRKKIPMFKKIIECYCDTKIIRMKYIENLSADNIAESENIDRRTVFKLIDKEMLSLGTWLYKNVYIPSVLDSCD